MNTLSASNIDFYEKISPEKFTYFAELLGMHTCNDVEEIYPLIAKATHLVELGSGYGRVLAHLLAKGFAGNITALERSSAYCKYLRDKFGEAISVHQQDILAMDFPFRADAILWMWSGITELGPKEAGLAVRRCYELLSEKGVLCIEAPHGALHYVGKMGQKKHVTVETEWGTLQAYLTDEQEVRSYAQQAGFRNVEARIYATEKNVERVIYILQK